MKKLISILNIIAIITISINTYAETSTSITDTATQDNVIYIEQTDTKTVDEIKNSIISDYDFNEYLIKKGITQKELEDVLNSDYFANYVEYELTQIPDNEIIASWDILDWHIQKLENFINYLFTGDKDYRANNNNNNYSNYNDNNYNRYNNNYNNMMPPPPPPPNTNWNNGWGQYPPNNSWNNGYNNNNNGINNNSNNNCSGNSCNCNCENCKNCLNK